MFPRFPKSPAASRFCRAFSLVEVVLALGVVSFGLVSILGLIPVGLGNFREARNLSVEAGIAQRLAGELRRTDATGQQTAEGVFYFDDQGTTAEKEAAVFFARVQAPVAVKADAALGVNAPAKMILITISARTESNVVNSYPILIAGEL